MTKFESMVKQAPRPRNRFDRHLSTLRWVVDAFGDIGGYTPEDVDFVSTSAIPAFVPQKVFPMVTQKEHDPEYDIRLRYTLGCIASRFSGREALMVYIVMTLHPQVHRYVLSDEPFYSIEEAVNIFADALGGMEWRQILDGAHRQTSWRFSRELPDIANTIAVISSIYGYDGGSHASVFKSYFDLGVLDFGAIKSLIDNKVDMSLIESTLNGSP